MDNAKIKIKAQVSLEFSAAFIALLILLVATTKLFVWFGNNIVERHKDYERTRTAAGVSGTEAGNNIPFYNQSEHQLKIFKE